MVWQYWFFGLHFLLRENYSFITVSDIWLKTRMCRFYEIHGHLFLPRRPEKTREDPKRLEKTRKDPKRPEKTHLFIPRRPEKTREDPKRLEKTRKDPKRHPKRPKKTRKDIFIVDVSEWKMTRVMLIVFEH